MKLPKENNTHEIYRCFNQDAIALSFGAIIILLQAIFLFDRVMSSLKFYC